MSGKSAFNGQGFMFLSPYYGKSKTTEILNRGLELDKLNAARQKAKAAAKAPKPNNWQPGKNSNKVHAKFSQAFNKVISDNYNWAVAHADELNKNSENYSDAMWAEWMKRKNGEDQFAQWISDAVTEHTTFEEQYNAPDPNDPNKFLNDRSSLAYAPLHITMSNWQGENNRRGNMDWQSEYFKDQQILMGDDGMPIPMDDGSNRLQTVNGSPVFGYDGFGEQFQDKRPESLIYNQRWKNVDNMNVGDWLVGPGGKIHYQGQEYMDYDGFDFGETLHIGNYVGNPSKAFLDGFPQYEGAKHNTVNGYVKQSFLNDRADEIHKNLGVKSNLVEGETVTGFQDLYAADIYKNLVVDYLSKRGNNNPNPTDIQQMITNADEYPMEPTQAWTTFIETMGWDRDDSGYDEYNLQNYALYKLMDDYMDRIGTENINVNEGAVMFDRWNQTTPNKLGETSYSTHGLGAAGKDSPYGDWTMQGYGYNHIYSNAKKVSTQFSIQPDENGVSNVFIENMPLAFDAGQGGTVLDLGGLNITLTGTWNDIYGMVVRTDKSGNKQFMPSNDDIEFSNKDEYVPFVKTVVSSSQVNQLVEKISQDEYYNNNPDEQSKLIDIIKNLKKETGQITIWVPMYDMYDPKGTPQGSEFYNGKGGRDVRKFNTMLSKKPDYDASEYF